MVSVYTNLNWLIIVFINYLITHSPSLGNIRCLSFSSMIAVLVVLCSVIYASDIMSSDFWFYKYVQWTFRPVLHLFICLFAILFICVTDVFGIYDLLHYFHFYNLNLLKYPLSCNVIIRFKFTSISLASMYLFQVTTS